MKKLFAAFLLLGALGCAVKKPAVVIPPEPALPGVMWQGDGTNLCVSPENAVKLRQREQLRDAYEDALRALLHAYGATDSK